MDGVIDAFYRIEGGFLVFRGREDFSSGLTPLPSVWLRVENVLTCGEIGVEAFFFTSAVL